MSKCFGDIVALDHLDLEIPAGTIHGVVGPNGAGKTTLLSLVLGLAQPSEGELQVLGEPVRAALAVPRGVNGFVDAPGLYPTLTARGNLVELGRLHRLDNPHRVDEVLDAVGLTDVAHDKVRGFSLGMRQRLGLAAALLTDPQLLVMDEPSNGLDPAGRLQIQQVLRGLADRGCTVLLSSHRMDDLSQLCDRVSLLAHGRVVFDGTVAALAARSPEVDMRVVSTDAEALRTLAPTVPGITIRPDLRAADDVVVRGTTEAMDEFVRRIIGAGIGLRELTPVMPPLEAAYLTLTGDHALVAHPEESAA